MHSFHSLAQRHQRRRTSCVNRHAITRVAKEIRHAPSCGARLGPNTNELQMNLLTHSFRILAWPCPHVNTHQMTRVTLKTQRICSCALYTFPSCLEQHSRSRI